MIENRKIEFTCFGVGGAIAQKNRALEEMGTSKTYKSVKGRRWVQNLRFLSVRTL